MELEVLYNISVLASTRTGDILFAADNLKPTITTDDNPALPTLRPKPCPKYIKTT